jgi:hypothetical protein
MAFSAVFAKMHTAQMHQVCAKIKAELKLPYYNFLH